MVGSGSGGSTTAARLCEANNYTTLLLEAGGRDPMLAAEVIKIRIDIIIIKYYFRLEF